MLIKTRGVVIKQTKFSDTGVIVNIYTEELGIQAFFVRGLRSRKSKNSMYQPLTILDLVVSFSEKKTMHTIKEVSVFYSYKTVTENMIKRTILFFIDELLYKSLKEEPQNKKLFDWIVNSLIWLDLTHVNVSNFYLVFMLHLTLFLGFYPKQNPSISYNYFDMQEGKFIQSVPMHQYYVSGNTVKQLSELNNCSIEDSPNLSFNNTSRKVILETLITYYKIHIPNFRDFNSLEILSLILK